MKGEKQDVFKDKMIKKGKWNLDKDIVQKEWLKTSVENLKDVGNLLRRLGRIQWFKQKLN